MFQHTFEIDSYWSLHFTWLKENGIVNKIENTNNFIEAKLKYQPLINEFRALINHFIKFLIIKILKKLTLDSLIETELIILKTNLIFLSMKIIFLKVQLIIGHN